MEIRLLGGLELLESIFLGTVLELVYRKISTQHYVCIERSNWVTLEVFTLSFNLTQSSCIVRDTMSVYHGMYSTRDIESTYSGVERYISLLPKVQCNAIECI